MDTAASVQRPRFMARFYRTPVGENTAFNAMSSLGQGFGASEWNQRTNSMNALS